MIAQIAALITAYRYWAILPFALFEAPLMSIIIGFFVATKQLNLFLSFGIVVGGDFLGDTALYIVGRWGRPVFEKVGFRLRLNSTQLTNILCYFVQCARRAIIISKLIHGVGFTGLIVAGSAKVPYSRFAVTCVAVTIIQSAVLVTIGILSGRAYQSFAYYLGYFNVAVTALLLLIFFVLYRSFVKKMITIDTKS
jgi:membrane protein DedA with SNARE-associated domain